VTFSPDVLTTWDQTDEVQLETSRGDGAPVHRTIIWIVIDGDAAYVRSVRGPAGRWYRELVANPNGAVHADDARTAVHALPVADPTTIARVSAAFRHKYEARWPGPSAAMLRDEVLPTTLRLEPASATQ
jgi:hypothetical protein